MLENSRPGVVICRGGAATLRTVDVALRHSKCAVVMLADSGGLAGALSLYLDAYQQAVRMGVPPGPDEQLQPLQT